MQKFEVENYIIENKTKGVDLYWFAVLFSLISDG